MNNGIYTDLSIEDYHANRTHLSSTQIRLSKKSLKEFDWYRRGLIKQEQKAYFDFGNAFELALLDKDNFSKKVAITKDSEWIKEALIANPKLEKPRSSKVYQAQRDDFYLGCENKYIIDDKGPESWETIQAMLESCYQDKAIQALVKNMEYQVSLFWTDEETGLGLKTRPDICKRKKNVIVNIKTTVDGSPRAFSKDLANHEYPLQAIQEITGCLKSGLMESVDTYFWLVVEKTAPFNATIYEFDQGDIKASMDEYRYLINKVSRAFDENLFPGYSDRADNPHGILKAEIPMYYRLLS
jgi:hypothetical protein